MNVRSEALFTFGITNASRLGAWRMAVRSSRARPEDTSFIRTEISRIEENEVRDWERWFRRDFRAGAFSANETESSRS